MLLSAVRVTLTFALTISALAGASNYAFADTGSPFLISGDGEEVVNIVGVNEMCLDLDHGDKKNGARIQQWKCNGSDAQKWRVLPARDSSFEIRSAVSGKCIEVENSSPQAGAAVQQWECNSGKQMQWQFIAVDGYSELQLRPMHKEDRCLDINKASSGNGAKAQQWYCNQTDAQRWHVVLPTEG
ncbi:MULTISPECIES: RICIN domain-containing protein [Streptomyces]|uniref:Ricin B lectin domain-containing protein n=1 Tax=Streptomyces netropsis TaxID=55404 RepID=A0A7W7LIQ3_STRNE|nr:RICIN domain-containing protein [Streptomyces netropsis]MBB4890381.1 hypothetical protein [Streptomyces netropsis]GGR46395.1 hypothetical protein GCM10010219_60010 [Streptomyces netropsis]